MRSSVGAARPGLSPDSRVGAAFGTPGTSGRGLGTRGVRDPAAACAGWPIAVSRLGPEWGGGRRSGHGAERRRSTARAADAGTCAAPARRDGGTTWKPRRGRRGCRRKRTGLPGGDLGWARRPTRSDASWPEPVGPTVRLRQARCGRPTSRGCFRAEAAASGSAVAIGKPAPIEEASRLPAGRDAAESRAGEQASGSSRGFPARGSGLQRMGRGL